MHPVGAKSSHTPPPLATPLATPSPPIRPTSSLAHLCTILWVCTARVEQLDHVHIQAEVYQRLKYKSFVATKLDVLNLAFKNNVMLNQNSLKPIHIVC